MSWKHGLATNHLADHAAKAPHIRGLRIFLRAQQNFGSAVPPGGDVVGEDGGKFILLFHGAYEPEIAYLGEAVLVDEYVGGFDVAVYEFSGVEVVEGLGGLVDDVAFVLFAEHVLADEGVQVDVHELEEDVDVALIERPDHLFQLHDVRVLELLQKHDLAVGALRIGRVLKGIEVLLQRVGPPRPPVSYLPNDSVGTAADLFHHLEPFCDVSLDLLVVSHLLSIINYQESSCTHHINYTPPHYRRTPNKTQTIGMYQQPARRTGYQEIADTFGRVAVSAVDFCMMRSSHSQISTASDAESIKQMPARAGRLSAHFRRVRLEDIFYHLRTRQRTFTSRMLFLQKSRNVLTTFLVWRQLLQPCILLAFFWTSSGVVLRMHHFGRSDRAKFILNALIALLFAQTLPPVVGVRIIFFPLRGVGYLALNEQVLAIDAICWDCCLADHVLPVILTFFGTLGLLLRFGLVGSKQILVFRGPVLFARTISDAMFRIGAAPKRVFFGCGVLLLGAGRVGCGLGGETFAEELFQRSISIEQ